MTFFELSELTRSGQKPVFRFDGEVDELESYAEAGMRARITAVHRKQDGLVVVHVDFSEFEAVNQPLETANYFLRSDRKGQLGTARDTGNYKPQDTFYADGPDEIARYGAIVDASVSALYEEYRTASDAGDYVQWLEAQVSTLRDASKDEIGDAPRPGA